MKHRYSYSRSAWTPTTGSVFKKPSVNFELQLRSPNQSVPTLSCGTLVVKHVLKKWKQRDEKKNRVCDPAYQALKAYLDVKRCVCVCVMVMGQMREEGWAGPTFALWILRRRQNLSYSTFSTNPPQPKPEQQTTSKNIRLQWTQKPVDKYLPPYFCWRQIQVLRAQR